MSRYLSGLLLGPYPTVIATSRNRRLPFCHVRYPSTHRRVLHELEHRLPSRIIQRRVKHLLILSVPNDLWSAPGINGPAGGEKHGADNAGHRPQREVTEPSHCVRRQSCDLEEVAR